MPDQVNSIIEVWVIIMRSIRGLDCRSTDSSSERSLVFGRLRVCARHFLQVGKGSDFRWYCTHYLEISKYQAFFFVVCEAACI